MNKQQRGYCKYHKDFEFPENATGNYRAKCRYCFKLVACSDKTKSHLLNHLRDHHPEMVPSKIVTGGNLVSVTPILSNKDISKNEGAITHRPSMRPLLPYPKLMPKLVLGVSPFAQQPSQFPYTKSRILPKTAAPVYSTPSPSTSTAYPLPSSQATQSVSPESSPLQVVTKVDTDDEAWMSTIKPTAPTINVDHAVEIQLNEHDRTFTGANSSNLEMSTTEVTMPAPRKRVGSELDQHDLSSKREKADILDQLKECSISQLLNNLRSISHQRQVELIRHTSNMNSLHEREAEIMAVISSKMGV